MTSKLTPGQDVTSLLGILTGKAEKFAKRTALCIKEGDNWRGLTFGELHDRSRQLASYLIELGIQRGDRVALLCESKPEWGACLFGSWRSGATVVPLDVKLTSSELYNIMSDCTPKVVLTSAKHLDVVVELQGRIPSIEHVYLTDDDAQSTSHKRVIDLVPQKTVAGVEREAQEVALFVYTSGTTGNPKAVMTTFANLIFQADSFKDMVGLSENDRMLSILPLNHLLELTAGFLGILNQGGMVCFCHSLLPKELIKMMNEKQITGMIAVPLFFKSIKGAIERDIKKSGDADYQKFQHGLEKAANMPFGERQAIFQEVHEHLGGKIRFLVSGGAPLELEVAQFFDQLGFPLLQGYGLTETSPVISTNTLKHNRLGSVGQPLQHLEVKIDKKEPQDESGEIITRGPHIMKGYYKRAEMTREVIDKDGWFHTGDLGYLDKDGYLFINGRLKNLIVLGGGKKIFPEEVEGALSGAASIKELCVLGRKSSDGFKEGQEEVCAVLVPSDDLAAKHGSDISAMEQAIKKDIDSLGENLAPYKRPTRLFIHPGELPKTATRKVKRQDLLKWMDTYKS